MLARRRLILKSDRDRDGDRERVKYSTIPCLLCSARSKDCSFVPWLPPRFPSKQQHQAFSSLEHTCSVCAHPQQGSVGGAPLTNLVGRAGPEGQQRTDNGAALLDGNLPFHTSKCSCKASLPRLLEIQNLCRMGQERFQGITIVAVRACLNLPEECLSVQSCASYFLLRALFRDGRALVKVQGTSYVAGKQK